MKPPERTELDPVTVARQMKIARDVDSKRQFSQEEVLSSMQIQSFVSRRAKFKNSEAQLVSDKDCMKQLKTVKKRCQPYEMRYWSTYSLSTQ